MALKSESRVIGEFEYTVTQLGAAKGMEVLRRLGKLGGGVAQGALRAAMGEGGDSAKLGALIGGLVVVLQSLEEVDIKYFVEVFGANSTVQLDPKRAPRVKEVFDLHFAGNYLDLGEWLYFCLEVNFGSFFGAAMSRMKERAASVKADQAPAA